jgi:hypothetical protein
MRYCNRSHGIEPIALSEKVTVSNFPATAGRHVVSGFSAILLN